MKKLIILLIILLILTGCSTSNLLDKPETKNWDTTISRIVGIHDPSIFVDTKDGAKTYYIFGTHISQAKSSDLTNWEIPKRNNGYVHMDENIIYGNTQENLAETFKWAGFDDADSKNGYNLWAPDVIYNEEYEWKDGSKGAYMYYYSASSTWRRSAIGYMVSPDVEGPYTYGNTIVYSGFTEVDATDGSDRNINYVNTHLPELIKNKEVSGFNAKWVRKLGQEYNTDYAPNALDPALIEDTDGKLWMVYGSWSGGIYLLEIDKKTGNPIYPYEDSQTEDGRHIDRYFGIKLAGGFHRSGEGPYIVHSEETGYYYLYLTYGGLAADGGYNMRVFRSESITGPYVDQRGSRPLFTQNDHNDNYGLKVMGNFGLDGYSKAYKSAGHNSALMDDDGNFLIFHTRFNNSGEAFELKVHEMQMNEEGWPVVLPYPYHVDLKTDTVLKTEEIYGSYEFVNHGINTSSNMLETQKINLNNDGTITGDQSGTYMVNDKNITMVINDVTYKGIIDIQKINNTREKLVFSLVGNNETIFGGKERK